MEAKPEKHATHQLLIAAALVLLVITVVYSLHHRQHIGLKKEAPHASPVIVTGVTGGDYQQDEANVADGNRISAEMENRNRRPDTIPDTLTVPVEARQALLMQTRQLSLEAADDAARPPEERRALSLTEEEIKKLQSEGRMIF